ncbi:uncharacterized protein LOC106636722 [Copidosoma floridanum]|uniref:uncharacterized protein LOC106636722 n=1 Tax=Copidosoma floridanum TaxID=29053 RepID=UPI0006C9B2D9|nr:uncharacterized protein LOC106636722 [Copidosoma floridanum]
MVERVHRTLKAGLMCNEDIPWPDALPLVLLGLRTSFKEDLQASPAEMLYGTTLRVPGEFFTTTSHPNADPPSFIQGLRQLQQSIKPVQASRHDSPHKPFIFRDLQTCTHVFKRVDAISKPLDPPYTGPHKVIRRIDNRNFTIEVNGRPRTCSTDTLKPAYLERADMPVSGQAETASPSPASRPNPGPPTPPPAPTSMPQPTPEPPKAAKANKRVSFSLPTADCTKRGAPVAVSASQSAKQKTRRKQQLIPRAQW